MNKTLVVFGKIPNSNQAKTRIARDLGRDSAKEIYALLLRHTLSEAEKLTDCKKVVFWLAEPGLKPPALPKDWESRWQSGDHLGARLENAFQALFSEGTGKVVVIGVDCPGLNAKILESAFEQLDNHDLVLGPALDGGYYLLGTASFHPELFRDIAWSTAQVLEQTKQIGRTLGLTMKELEPLRDIDTARDWEIWKKETSKD